jgi:phosphoribosylanthranilate isomerase
VAVKVKVCGVTDPANALAAVEMGADYLGLNFYPGSPRYVSVERAREIAGAVGGRVPLVGVFVNAPAATIAETVERAGLDLVQLSGDEGPETVGPLASRTIKAFRTGGLPGGAELAAWSAVWGVLIDAPHRDLYGGTGEEWAYEGIKTASAADLAGQLAGQCLFLAGGIGPDNVRRAVEAARPYAIDVCSRVESAPGIKDLELLRRLFQEVRDGETPNPS